MFFALFTSVDITGWSLYLEALGDIHQEKINSLSRKRDV